MDNLEKKSFLIKLNSIATDVPHTVIAFNYINEYYKSLTDIEKDEFYDWAFEISHFIPKLCIKAKISKTHFKANVGSMDCEQTWEIPTPPNFEFKEHIEGRTYYFFKYWIEHRTNKIEWVNNWLEEAKEEAQKKTDEETINIEKDLEFIPKSEQQAHLISLQKEWFKKFKTIKYNPEEKDFFHPEHWEIPEFEHNECTLPSTCYVIGSMFYYHYKGVVNWLKEKVEQSNDILPQQNETLPNVVQIKDEAPQQYCAKAYALMWYHLVVHEKREPITTKNCEKWGFTGRTIYNKYKFMEKNYSTIDGLLDSLKSDNARKETLKQCRDLLKVETQKTKTIDAFDEILKKFTNKYNLKHKKR